VKKTAAAAESNRRQDLADRPAKPRLVRKVGVSCAVTLRFSACFGPTHLVQSDAERTCRGCIGRQLEAQGQARIGVFGARTPTRRIGFAW